MKPRDNKGNRPRDNSKSPSRRKDSKSPSPKDNSKRLKLRKVENLGKY